MLTCASRPPVAFHVEGDKGFLYSATDDAFVCQKKNHFQVSVMGQFSTLPSFVCVDGEYLPIDGLNIYAQGLKVSVKGPLKAANLEFKIEMPPTPVLIEQSQSDRRKIPLVPAPVEVSSSFKTTLSRLHFGETTANNMRKRGLPNPAQCYFVLVISLVAEAKVWCI